MLHLDSIILIVVLVWLGRYLDYSSWFLSLLILVCVCGLWSSSALWFHAWGFLCAVVFQSGVVVSCSSQAE